MPLPKRTIEPIHVARSVFAREELPSELETVTNTTLTNIVRQLSSLSKHSEDLFGELARDASNLAERANSLQARIDRLAVKVTQLDSTVEEVSLQVSSTALLKFCFGIYCLICFVFFRSL
jgi:WAS protein family, member 3